MDCSSTAPSSTVSARSIGSGCACRSAWTARARPPTIPCAGPARFPGSSGASAPSWPRVFRRPSPRLSRARTWARWSGWSGGNLGSLLESSGVGRRLRALTVGDKPVCRTCKFRFLCGGGDVEHSYSFSLGRTPVNGHGSFDHLDPYCDLYQGLITDRLFALALEGRAAHRADTGFNAPVIYHAMGEGSLA